MWHRKSDSQEETTPAPGIIIIHEDVEFEANVPYLMLPWLVSAL
jgi:hypothetical protein